MAALWNDFFITSPMCHLPRDCKACVYNFLFIFFFCISFKVQGLTNSICICLLMRKLQLIRCQRDKDFVVPCQRRINQIIYKVFFPFKGDKATLRATGLGDMCFCQKKKKLNKAITA